MAKIIRKKSTSTASQVEESVSETTERKRREVDVNNLIPSPCVPFNLECSGCIEGAFSKGTIVNLIGDSHAGKTLFALSILAECTINKNFSNYRLIYDDVEHANEFDIAFLFGEDCEDRIETGIVSRTIEDFGDNVARALESDKPFIYVLDSADALTSEAAIELDAENRKKREKGNETKGSYGDGKAKAFSHFFTMKVAGLDKTESFILIISQTRDNIGFGAQFNPKVRSGGKALKFYSFHEIWLAMMKKEKKGDRTYKTDVQAKITKNKLTGRHGVAHFPILFDFGIDNVASCIYFLLNEKHWTGTIQAINTKGWYPNGVVKIADLVSYIETGNHEKSLFQECKNAYDAVMKKMSPTHRKRRY